MIPADVMKWSKVYREKDREYNYYSSEQDTSTEGNKNHGSNRRTHNEDMYQITLCRLDTSPQSISWGNTGAVDAMP